MTAAPTEAAPATQLQSATVHQNRTISIVGSGFTPGGTVTWDLVSPNGKVVSVDEGSVDDDGKVYRQVTPTLTTPPGDYTLELTDTARGGVADAPLQVLPAADAPPLWASFRTAPSSDGQVLVHVSGLPSDKVSELALTREGISGLAHITSFRADHDGHSRVVVDTAELKGSSWVLVVNTGDGWFTDGTTVSPPPSGPFIHFGGGKAAVHQGHIARISAHNLPEHSSVTWQVHGPDGTDAGTWRGTATEGSDSQWLAAPAWMEPGMYTVEIVAPSDSTSDAVTWSAFEVLPADDAPANHYSAEVSANSVARGDVVNVTVRGGGIHAGLIPVNTITNRSVSEDLSLPDEIGRRTAELDTAGLPPEYDLFYVAVHDGHTWHLTGTEISVEDPGHPRARA
ncbi:hypothetical protein [Myceligenerans indicum]|uniref:Uncharacterized protein n=1 Tax=Myceligenerans indicum TaxID=2593663 RepID=A0ABS1LM45_9MICO|nr:hypothetical protein [Myceligenerans indicum]MBL0887322.1 hypothetical protein [Myceligenerans indicum]